MMKDQQIQVERLYVEEMERRVAPLVVLKPPRLVKDTIGDL